MSENETPSEILSETASDEAGIPTVDRFLVQVGEVLRLARAAAVEHRSGDAESRGADELLSQVTPHLEELAVLAPDLDSRYREPFTQLCELVNGCVREGRQALASRDFGAAYPATEGLEQLLDQFLAEAPDVVKLAQLIGQIEAARTLMDAEADDFDGQAATQLRVAIASAESLDGIESLAFAADLREALRDLEDEDGEDAEWLVDDTLADARDVYQEKLEKLLDVEPAL